MTLSEWKNNFDEKNPGMSIRAISLEDLMNIDVKEEKMKQAMPCKHSVEYAAIDMLDGELVAEKLTYFQLSKKDQEMESKSWEDYAPNRCAIINCVS